MSTTEIIKEKINKKISRRSFLKWSAAIGATSSISGLVLNSASKMAGATASDSEAPATAKAADGGQVVEWVPTHCLVCHSWCQLAVGIDQDGLARKIEGQGGQYATTATASPDTRSGAAMSGGIYKAAGAWGNPDDGDWPANVPDGYLPYGLNNKGRICAKGNTGLQTLYDPDRVKYPLKRVGDRGSGAWERISWRQAYYEIATVARELNGYATTPTGAAIAGARGKNYAHRHVLYIGRNESDNTGKFEFNSHNHIEHTSLCESSRHQSTLTLFGHHFPFPDLNTHTGTRNSNSAAAATVDFILEIGGNPAEAKIPHSSIAVRWGDRRRNDCRIAVVDVRQSNSASFADEFFPITPGEDGALAMTILGLIFKNVGAATLGSEMLAGHLGGIAHNNTTRRYTGIFKAEKVANGGPATFTPSKAGANVAGAPTLAAGTTSLPAPTDTLEDELDVVFGAPLAGLTSAAIAAWGEAKTGILAADLLYLAGAVGGATLNADGTISSWTGGTPTFLNPSVDGYRGPAKHSNGTYSWRAIRTLTVLSGRFKVNADAVPGDGTGGFFDPAGPNWARGGIERPGGLMVNGWGANTAGAVGNYSAAAQIGGSGGVGAAAFANIGTPPNGTALNIPVNTYPYASNKWNSKHDKVTIDRWDYDQGRNKFGIGTQGVDQNTVPAIRASLGLHPYIVGQTVTVRRTSAAAGDVILPYGFRQTAFVASTTVTGVGPYVITTGPQSSLGNLTGGATAATAKIYKDGGVVVDLGDITAANSATGEITVTNNPGAVKIGDHVVCDITDTSKIPDENFAVESVMLIQNAPGNTRPNIKLYQELATAKDGGGNYLLKNLWSIDPFMGDGSRYADIILPDTTYLERYDGKDWENMGLKGWYGMRQPVNREDMTKAIWEPGAKDKYLYDARPVSAMGLEITNACAGKLAADGGGAGGYAGYTSASEIWAACLLDEDYVPTIAGTEGQPWDALGLGGIGAQKQIHFNKAKNGTIPGIVGGPSDSASGRWAFIRAFGNIYDSNQVINEYTGFDSDFFGHGGWAKQNAARSWLNDDLVTAGSVAAWADNAAGPVNGYTALEVFNRRMTQILEPGLQVAGTQPEYSDADGYNFKGVPVYQTPSQATSATYGRHLTTYKVNVHTQSRTAQSPNLMEITGSSWAVMGPDGSDASGYYVTGADSVLIRNGDTVKVETAQGSVTLEAKVTPKGGAGCVHISTHFGHEKASSDVGDAAVEVGETQGVSTLYGDAEAFGNYTVDGADNRVDADANYNDAYSVALPPTAPGHGVHPCHAICRTGDNLATTASMATDPIGTSVAWMDSKCKVTKV